MRFKIEITTKEKTQSTIETDDYFGAKALFEKFHDPELIILTDRIQKTKKIRNAWG